MGQHFSCFYSCEDVAAGLPDHELELATRNGCYEDEGWRFRKDGSRFWARVSISALRDVTGKLVGFGKVTRDLTEGVLPNEQFRLAIEATPTGMMMINQAGEIVLVNSQLERLFGYARQELIGKPAITLVPKLPPAFLDAVILRAGLDLHGLRKDGSEVPIEVGLNPLHSSEGDFLLSSVVDISERKRAEREREALLGQFKELNTELERRVQTRTVDLSTALQEREVLLQEVHHRVKNNLQVVASLINLHARGAKNDDIAAAYASIQRRVDALSVVHRNHFAELEENRGVALKPLISELATNLRATA
ncbi:MAG TPA: PAS domain S-box protein, partial [Polyangiaceae bacterium]